MKYIIIKDGLQELIAQLESNLSKIEVKGESVGYLFIARTMFKELAESIQAVPEEEKKGD